MEKHFLFDNENKLNNKYEEENKKNKCCGPSELALRLRKQKINEKIGKSRVLKINNQSVKEFGKQEITKLNELSKNLYEQKNQSMIIEILDKLYFFLINFKEPIKLNYIESSKIIQNLYAKLAQFKDKEIIITKIFDVFEQLVKLISFLDEGDKNCIIFNNQYHQLLYGLIDFYQNNSVIIEKIYNFITTLIEKSDILKENLMTKPGFYFIQALFSLDTKYPLFFIKLMHSFCSCNNINDQTMKDFEIMFAEKCNKVISLFYAENHSEPKDVINNSFIFINVYKCIVFISQCEHNEILDIFLNNRSDVTLLEKILAFEKFDKDHLTEEVLKLIGNLYCSSEITYIQTLIELNIHQYVMDELTQVFNKNNILENAAWAMSNFVNIEQYRKIFIKNGYIKDLTILLKKIHSYDVMNEILSIILNIFNAINEVEMYSFTDSDITGCLVYLLKNTKEPNLLSKILAIIQILLIKGDPNFYLNDYYKYRDDKITNVYLYQFEYCGLYDVLNHLSITNKHDTVSELAQGIIEHFFLYNK
jgi:hypothetical protein